MAGERMTATVIDRRPEYIIEVDRDLTELEATRLRQTWTQLWREPTHWHTPGTPYPRLRALDGLGPRLCHPVILDA
jgi:hypothetical protein